MQVNSLGNGSFLSPMAVIRRPHMVTIGHHTNIDEFVLITCQAFIGDYCHIAPAVTIIGGANGYFSMGDFCTIACGSRIITVSDEHKGFGLIGPTIPPEQRDRLITFPVIMERFASVTSNVVISPGVILREGVVIGANSYVPAGYDTQPWTFYAGSPVRRIGERDRFEMYRKAKELGY